MNDDEYTLGKYTETIATLRAEIAALKKEVAAANAVVAAGVRDYDSLAKAWGEALVRAKRAEAALWEIVTCDYRGNMPPEQVIARRYFAGEGRER